MVDDPGVALDADLLLALPSPSLVWRVGLPGAPDCWIVATSTPVRLASSQRPLGDGHVEHVLGGLMETIVERRLSGIS